MIDNFNPGFDREKKVFLDLANRGDGLCPIEYLYAGDASFESVLVSYLKGGTFDINILFVDTIEAKNIITSRIEAVLAIIDEIHIKNEYVGDLYANNVTIYDKLTVGTEKRAEASFYTTDFNVDSDDVDFTTDHIIVKNTAEIEVASSVISMDTLLYTVIAEYASITCPTGLISFNTPLFEINPIESSIVPTGAVGIYSGGTISISAPTTTIGATARFGAQPTLLTLNALENITIGNPILNSPKVLNILGRDVNISGQTLGILAREATFDSGNLTANIDVETIIEAGNLLYLGSTETFIIKSENEGSLSATILMIKGNQILNLTAGETININAGAGILDITAGTTTITSTTNITGATNIAGNVDITGATCDILSGTVNITGNGGANIMSTSVVRIEGAAISAESPRTMNPIPMLVVGTGALLAGPVPVIGEISFELPFVLTCTGGTLQTVNITVVITCA